METPLGPFGLMDRVGFAVVRDIEQVYFEEPGDPSDACAEFCWTGSLVATWG